MSWATVKEGPKWEVGQYKDLLAVLVFLFTESVIDSAHVSSPLNLCFLCLYALKHLTWTTLPCIHPKFVTREVFSHSSSEGGEILGPIIVAQLFANVSGGLCNCISCHQIYERLAASEKMRRSLCDHNARACKTDGLTCSHIYQRDVNM